MAHFLAILVLGVGLAGERVMFLWRRRFDADGLIRRIEVLCTHRDWDGCRRACDHLVTKPLARVVQAGLTHCRAPRREMEDALQEAILKEVPAMERFLSNPGHAGRHSPLLGLLGTVTGMIDTFQVITRHGTGDPRMMSGGISVALVNLVHKNRGRHDGHLQSASPGRISRAVRGMRDRSRPCDR
jgi:biopolymer transport protein ExbB